MDPALKNARFLLLVTFRESGEGVPTPVWFGEHGDLLYMRTLAGSPKTRRIRAQSQVEVAPCEGDGRPLAEPVPGQARLVDAGEAIVAVVDAKLDEKYGEERLAMTRDFRDDQGHALEWIEVTLEVADEVA
ncbi:MAG: PPOX class F420-dependent oxidoreductase [Myxococcota bacterium]